MSVRKIVTLALAAAPLAGCQSEAPETIPMTLEACTVDGEQAKETCLGVIAAWQAGVDQFVDRYMAEEAPVKRVGEGFAENAAACMKSGELSATYQSLTLNYHHFALHGADGEKPCGQTVPIVTDMAGEKS